MGKPTGFLEYERMDGLKADPKKRIENFNEFTERLSLKEQQKQGARCMDCGVPFCQSGCELGGMTSGCPLKNLVPEMNDLVYHGNWEQAYIRLNKTHNFPEFTCRVCPALCEAACTCGIHSEPVSTKENERAVIEYAFEQGLVQPRPPKVRTGKKVAVVGSGPAGLAVADQLNRRGHEVTVYERSDRPGGLLMYGIPNMKLEKKIVDRRIALMEASGIRFLCNVDVGKDIAGAELLKEYERVVLACGASQPRDIQVPGREAEGIYFAVDFLSQVTRQILGGAKKNIPAERVKNRNVLVVGGGDTGNDCVGTVIRLGAASVIQLEMMPEAPKSRAENNPWPQWPKVLKTDYGQQEAIALWGEDPRVYRTTITEFLTDENNHVTGARTVLLEPVRDEETGRVMMQPKPGTEKELAADMVLIAAGFLGSQAYIRDTFGVECNERSNVKTGKGSYATNVDRVFAAGDMHRGQSLVVWAIAEGREAAREVDESLMGYSPL